MNSASSTHVGFEKFMRKF